MARIVKKFGGTSVADVDRIKAVALRVKRAVDAGDQVAVVVSAMAGVTNRLVAHCVGISPLHDAREYDIVVASGEQVTAGLLAIALQELGVPARSWLGWQIPIPHRRRPRQARIRGIDDRRTRSTDGQGEVPVVAGFQGLASRSTASRRSAAAARTPLRSRWPRR